MTCPGALTRVAGAQGLRLFNLGDETKKSWVPLWNPVRNQWVGVVNDWLAKPRKREQAVFLYLEHGKPIRAVLTNPARHNLTV
jgi:hypothetical protein